MSVPREFILILAVLTSQKLCEAACPLQGGSNCLCIGDVIDCTRQNISNTEKFRPVNSNEFRVLSLSGNVIHTVQNGSFVNVNVSVILIDNNQIDFIDHDAFRGLSRSLKVLNLENNSLNTVPSALKNLNVLQTLNLKNNPITFQGFVDGDSAFKHLGLSMREFHFGDESQSFWPRSISHFVQLRTLYIYSTSIQVAPPQAFHGFERTLLRLHITNTKLSIVPNSIEALTRLEELYFDDNVNVGDQNIVSVSFKSLGGSLHTLSLQNNSLTTFPKILFDLTSLHNLTMDRNKLWYISDDAISNLNSNISYLSFKQCNLDRIPQALQRVTPLQVLDLTGNNIHSIEREDLNYLRHFKKLIAKKNPLRYISTAVFKSLDSLVMLDFSHSLLPEIPTAIKNAPTLQTLKFTNAPIACTCDLYWYLKSPFVNKTMQIEGRCDTINMAIADYLKKRVPLCPPQR